MVRPRLRSISSSDLPLQNQIPFSSTWCYFALHDAGLTLSLSLVVRSPASSPISPKMSPTTRSQMLARRTRRKSLQSYTGTGRVEGYLDHTSQNTRSFTEASTKSSTRKPESDVGPQEVDQTSYPAPNLINKVLPYDILRIIMLDIDEEALLLLQCQRVCKSWADIISGLPIDLSKLCCFDDSPVSFALHFDALRMKGQHCTHDSPEHQPMRAILPCLTYEKASWRRYLRNHLSESD